MTEQHFNNSQTVKTDDSCYVFVSGVWQNAGLTIFSERVERMNGDLGGHLLWQKGEYEWRH